LLTVACLVCAGCGTDDVADTAPPADSGSDADGAVDSSIAVDSAVDATGDSARDADTSDGGPVPIECDSPAAPSVVATVEGTVYDYRRSPMATLVGDHIRVEADELALGLERWIVTVPNRVGTYSCGDTPQLQVALIGVPGIVGEGGAASATETLGSCTVTVHESADAAGGDVTGCFVATLSTEVTGLELFREVVDGRFRGTRTR